MNLNDFKILIVDDEEEYLEVLSLILQSKGYNTETTNSPQIALDILMKKPFDLVLSDLIMDGMSGMDLLKKMKLFDIEVDFIMVTGYGSISNAVEAIKEGAFSYFIKGSDPEELLAEISKLARLQKVHPKEVEVSNQPLLKTKNKEMQHILSILQKVSKTDISILLTGKSGVGKEVFARYIHDHSQRVSQKFVPINCAALSKNLLESELFGHEKGAFTGANQRRIGRFEEANNGTLFLDEMGEMDHETQVKLLRVLESKSIERVGGNENIPVNIRLITATNRDLAAEVESGHFRKDLFYRINAINIEIPPLSQRKEDIFAFFDYFVQQFEERYQKSIKGYDSSVTELLQTYEFPGNIRELKNMVERGVVLTDDGYLKRQDLLESTSCEPMSVTDLSIGSASMKELTIGNQSLRELRKEAEKQYIILVLKTYKSDLNKTAEQLDITKRQLFNKIKEFDIKY